VASDMSITHCYDIRDPLLRHGGRGQLKCDGTRAETRFRLSAKRTSPFKSTGASVQSTTGSRGVRISGSNAGYTMFRGSVKSTGYLLHFASFPFTSPPVRHRVPSHFNRTLPLLRHGHTIRTMYWHHCFDMMVPPLRHCGTTYDILLPLLRNAGTIVTSRRYQCYGTSVPLTRHTEPLLRHAGTTVTTDNTPLPNGGGYSPVDTA